MLESALRTMRIKNLGESNKFHFRIDRMPSELSGKVRVSLTLSKHSTSGGHQQLSNETYKVENFGSFKDELEETTFTSINEEGKYRIYTNYSS